VVRKSVLFVLVVAFTSICSGQWLERQVILGDTLGGIYAPRGFATNPLSGSEYVAAMPVRIFDPATRLKVRDLDVSGGVVFCPSSGKGYVVWRETLLIVDAAADTTMGRAALSFVPDFQVYSPASNRLYLGANGADTLLVFDPDGDTVLHRIGIGAAARALVWDAARNRMYIGVASDAGVLKVLDCAADTLLPDVWIGFTTLEALALSTVSRKIYCTGTVSDSWGGIVAVSTDSLVLVDTVTQSGEVDVMVYSPVTDRVYCPAADVESLLVIDCRSDSIRAQLEAPYVTALAVSTLNGKAYVGLEDSTELVVLDTLDSIVGRIPTPNVPYQYTTTLAFRPDRNELYGITTSSRVFVVDASADTVTSVLNYATYLPRQIVHNPAGNKLYLLCPAQDEVLVVDSTFAVPKHILGGATDSDALPVLNPALNRLYVADGDALRVIDCNSDSLLESKPMYGIDAPIPVMVPYINRLFVFEGSGSADSVYAYDFLRNTVAAILYLSDGVPSAVFDPRTNRIYFACEDPPAVRALNPVTGIVERTFDLAGYSNDGRLALNLDLGRLYYTDQSPNRMFTIDLLAGSVIDTESLPWDIDTMFLDRRLQKPYLCSRQHVGILVYDCNRAKVIDTIAADYHYAGLLDELNDKLYLRYGAVVDCRYDSLVTTLPDSLNPRSMAWDPIDNRVFQANANWLYVYRDGPYGVQEQKVGFQERRCATIVRGVLFLPRDMTEIRPGISDRVPRPVLLDISGRKVLDLRAGANDVRALPTGVYFIRQSVGSRTTKIVVQR